MLLLCIQIPVCDPLAHLHRTQNTNHAGNSFLITEQLRETSSLRVEANVGYIGYSHKEMLTFNYEMKHELDISRLISRKRNTMIFLTRH